MCQAGFSSCWSGVCLAYASRKVQILVYRLRDDVEIEFLGGLRFLPLVERQAFCRRVGKPLLDRNAIAFRLRDLLAFFVEEEFVDELVRRLGAEDPADLGIDRRVGLMVLAEHLEVDAKRRPAHAEVGLPLQFHIAAGHGQRRVLAVLVRERHRASLGVDRLHRHVEHAARGRRDRKEWRICFAALVAKRGQHHLHDVIVFFGGAKQHRVEPPRPVERGRRREFVFEAEGVKEGAEPRIHVSAIALVRAEGIGHGGERLLHVGMSASPDSEPCPESCASRPCRRRRR